jgi:hypothetical protein
MTSVCSRGSRTWGTVIARPRRRKARLWKRSPSLGLLWPHPAQQGVRYHRHFFGSNFGRTSWASTSSAPLSRSCRANLPALETNENMLQGQSLTTKRIQHSRRDSWIDASVVSIAHVFRIPMSFNRSIRSMGRFMISMDIEIRKVAVSGPKSGRPACRVFSTCGQSSSINCKQGCGSLH